jgi:Pentapeptide repeats (8 copies)
LGLSHILPSVAYVFKDRNPPPKWADFRKRARHRSLVPFYRLTWAADWAAYFLGKWPMVELLEYLGSFSILFAVIFYVAGAPDRLRQKHYQAWQVINTAAGKGGNGGRIDALQELNDDGVSLIGVGVSNAYLEGLRLEKAQARRANFSESDLRGADFKGASLDDADLHWANFRGADLRRCSLTGASLDDADLFGASLAGADVAKASLERADLHDADLRDLQNWNEIKSIQKANIFGVRNAPIGFVTWATNKGAIQTNSE